jgi:HSP20 family protein
MSTLTKFNGTNNIASSFFDDFFEFPLFARNTPNYEFDPSFDVIENENEFRLDLMLPAFSKENIKTSIEDNYLTISAERQKTEENYRRKSSFFGKFEKSFKLPEFIITDKIDASFVDGVLSVIIPKDNEKLGKKVIEVR